MILSVRLHPSSREMKRPGQATCYACWVSATQLGTLSLGHVDLLEGSVSRPFLCSEGRRCLYHTEQQAGPHFTLERERLDYHFPGHLLYNFLEKIVLKKKGS